MCNSEHSEGINLFRENMQDYQKRHPRQRLALVSILGENTEFSTYKGKHGNQTFMASNAVDKKIRYKR